MNWEKYAQHYDLMCEMNPPYKENVDLTLALIKKYPIPRGARVGDFGAGTGNYIHAISRVNDNCVFYYVDSSEAMADIARRKLSHLPSSRLNFEVTSFENWEGSAEQFDLIICINSLYAMADPRAALRRIRDSLSPSGYAIIIDFGRMQNTLDWALYLFSQAAKSGILLKYCKGLVTAREVLRQNSLTRFGQQTGRYWLHTTEEFGQILEIEGLRLKEIGSCYRGYCDYALVERRVLGS